jgi:hypothetical protein
VANNGEWVAQSYLELIGQRASLHESDRGRDQVLTIKRKTINHMTEFLAEVATKPNTPITCLEVARSQPQTEGRNHPTMLEAITKTTPAATATRHHSSTPASSTSW